MGLGCQPHALPPTWRTRVSLFFWAITFDLSGMGGPTSSFATANISQDHLTKQVPPLHFSMDTFGGGAFICRNDFILLSGTAGFRGL